MSESSARAFRREKISNLSVSLMGNYICTKGEGEKLGFKTLRYIDKDGDEDIIKIKDIFAKDVIRIKNLFSILDDLVAFDFAKFGVKGQLNGFWSRFKEENFFMPEEGDDADSSDPTDIIKRNLSQCDQAIRLIYRVLGASDYIHDKEEQSEKSRNKYTFGSLLFDEDIDKFIDNGKGRYDNNNPSVRAVISVLLDERNKWAIHPKTAVDNDADGSTNIALLLEECRNKTAIVLVALLHIVDYHYDALDRYFVDFFEQEENRKLLKGETTVIPSVDPEVLKRDYVQSLLVIANEQLRKNVGHVGNIVNDEELKLMNLKMQLIWKDEAPVIDNSDSEQDGDFSQSIKSIELKQITSKRDDEDHVNVILGNPGSGKSTLLTQLQKNLCSSWLEGDVDAAFPVSLALKSVGKGNFIDSIKDSVGERLFPFIEQLCKDGRVVFILDGLNELPLSNPKNYLDTLEKAIRSEYKGCRFYITGRIHEFEDVSGRFQSLKECSIYQMREISEDDIIVYFKELKASDKSTNTFLDWIRNAQIANLLASPLNFSMISKMVLNQEDHSVPVETINNRGELLDLFLKSTLQDKGVLTSGIEGETFRILQYLALAIDKQSNRPIALTVFSSYCKNFYPEMSTIERELILREYLEVPCRLNVLNKSVDINGAELYSFNIDTFQEFFHARSFAVEFVGNVSQGVLGRSLSECLSEGFDVKDKRRREMLRLALELIAGGRIQKETAEKDGSRFVQDFLHVFNNSYGVLAELSAYLPLTSEARSIVEQEVIERMVSYREINVMPAPEDDKDELLDIVKSAVRLSTDALFGELFNFYWMSATGMVAHWEFGFSFTCGQVTLNQYRSTLVSNCTDPIKFYDNLHRRALDILPIYSASPSFLNLTRNLLFSELTTYRQKILYNHIRECYELSINAGSYGKPDHLLSQDSSLLLMYMDDPEYIKIHLDLEEMSATGTKIGTHTLMKLLRNYLNPCTPQIIFQKKFLDLLEVSKPKGDTEEERNEDIERQRNFKVATIIRFFLFRNDPCPELLNYLSPKGENGLESLNEHERLPILDMLPISELRAYKERYFDSDVFQYLDENDDEEESKEGLHYRIYEKDKDQTLVWIRDIASPLKGLTAVIGSIQAEIVGDEQIIKKQYRFKLTSPAIINATGIIRVADKEIMYVVPFSDAEVIYTTFNEEIARLLSLSNTVIVGESQVCKVEKVFESQPQSWRVLSLSGNIDVPYYGDMQFTSQGESVDIDKTIRDRGYRFDPQLYRRLQNLPTQNCSDVQYMLMGSSGAKVWIITDKLMNYDRYQKDGGAYVRPTGGNVHCRFLEAHPFTEGFVELTFRSAVPFDFPKDGVLIYSYDNQEEGTVSYIFCHCSGTRSVVRISDSVFVKLVKDHEKRMALMSGYFRIDRISLLLDYVEILPGSERLSIWTLQRLSTQAFPNSGTIEVYEDDSFQKSYQLSFTNETRRKTTSFVDCRRLYCDEGKNQALYVIRDTIEPIAPGLYLTNDDYSIHLRVLESNTCLWMAQTLFVPEMIIPTKGLIQISGLEGSVHFVVRGQTGSTNSVFVYAYDNEIDFNTFNREWENAAQISFTTEDGRLITTGFRKKDPLVIEPYRDIVLTDTTSGIGSIDCSTDKWYLSVYCPIRNEIERVYDSVVKTIKVHSVSYTVASSNQIKFLKPVTEFENLYVQFGGSSRYIPFVVDETDNNNIYGIEYCQVTLQFEKGKRIELTPRGKISFFSKGADGFIPVSVGYRRVLEVIDIKKSRKNLHKSEEPYSYYPAQICDVLFKELSDLKVINEDLVSFFAEHSRAYMLMMDSQFKTMLQTLKCEEPLINLCTVTDIEKEGKITSFSWLTNTLFPSMDVVDSRLKIGDLIYVELNHKITIAELADIKGNIFPTIGEIPAAVVDNSYYEVSETTWQDEVLRIETFKTGVKRLIEFFSNDGPSSQLSVVNQNSDIETDSNGIVVVCPQIPELSLRLCSGLTEKTYESLMNGEEVKVVPSQDSQRKFNPYRYTPKWIVSVVDASLRLTRNSVVYCLVKNFNAKKENVVGVVCGNDLGSFINHSDEKYNNGQLVRLKFYEKVESDKGTWLKFNDNFSNSGPDIGELNLHVGDEIDNIVIVNNGRDGNYIEVEYRVQDGAVKGTVDNRAIPDYSSRLINGIYSPGTIITGRITEILPEQSSFQIELVNLKVNYPYSTGIYDCVIHCKPKPFFSWRVTKKIVAAWATFVADGESYTVEIPPKEMLEFIVGKKNPTNVYEHLLNYEQEYAAKIEILGFSELGDPIISLRSLNEKRVRSIKSGNSFLAEILYVDSFKRQAIWHGDDTWGVASFNRWPRVKDKRIVRAKDGDDTCVFHIMESDINHTMLFNKGDVITVFPKFDGSLLEKGTFIAKVLVDGVFENVICKHSRMLFDYWVEYFIQTGDEIRAQIEDWSDGIYTITFIPEIENNWNGLKWSRESLYTVSVFGHTPNFVLVQYQKEDGNSVLGAIYSGILDSLSWRINQYPIGKTLSVRTIKIDYRTRSVIFAPTGRISPQFPYGLKDGETTDWIVFDTNEHGDVFVSLKRNQEIRKVLNQFEADWSVLASGKPLLKKGDIKTYKVNIIDDETHNKKDIKLRFLNSPWGRFEINLNKVYPVVIERVDEQDVLVSYDGIYGEIRCSELEDVGYSPSVLVGETINARILYINTFSHVVCFTVNGIKDIIPKQKIDEPKIGFGDIVECSIKDYLDDFTPIVDWKGKEIQVTPAHAAFLAQKPWLERVSVKKELPVGTTYRFVTTQVSEDGNVLSVKPYNRGSDAFRNKEEINATVLQCTDEGIYARTIEDGDSCLVFVPKDEIIWGRVYTANNTFEIGEKISVVTGAKPLKPILVNASIKRNYAEPRLTLDAGEEVKVRIEKILPAALNVICKDSLRLQIAVEDTTWNPAYLLGQQADLAQRFSVGQELSATVEDGGTDKDIRLSLRDHTNPWEFDQIVVGDEWKANVVKILDSEHFVVNCRGLFVRVSNKLNLEVKNQTWVLIRIREVIPDEPYASALLVKLLPDKGEEITLVESEQIPFKIGDRIQVRITRIHHHLMVGDVEDYLDCEPIGFSFMHGRIPNYELAWESKRRSVEQYRVGDELSVIVTGIDYMKMSMTASIREVGQNIRDSRTINDIVSDNDYDEKDSNRIREEITVRVIGAGQQIRKETKQVSHYVDFAYSGYDGRISLNSFSWSAVQSPETFFKKGRSLRVRVIGKGEFFDKSSYQKKEFLKATIPFIRDIHWEELEKRQGNIAEPVTILCIDDDELFVRFADHFVVKMGRDTLLWEPTLPLNQRFKVGQIIPVYVKSISAKKRIIELNHRCTKVNPYNDNLEIQVGDICEGKIVAEVKDRYYLDIDIKDNNRVTCVLPFDEFPYKWHRKYDKGDYLSVVIIERNLENCQLIASRKDARIKSDEESFVADHYYWFKVAGYKKEGIILSHDKYPAFMSWKDAKLENISDPSDMYPIGLECLLRIKTVDALGTIITEADYNWDIGLNNIKHKSKFWAEVCLRNPANGIIMRVRGTEDQFCFVTRKNFSEPLLSDILSYEPKEKYRMFAQTTAKDKVYAVFERTQPIKPAEADYCYVRPGMVVTGRVKRISDKYVIVLYNNIQISVDKDYVDVNVKVGDALSVRITHHEYYRDLNKVFVSKKLLGSAYGVYNDPFKELPIGKQVTGLVAIVPTKKGEVNELRVDIPHRGTVIGRLLTQWGKTVVYRGQKVIAYVASHNYDTHEVQFTLYRPDSSKLFVGTILKANVLAISEDNVSVDASFGHKHYSMEIPLDSFYWGSNPSVPCIKVGERYNMAVTSVTKLNKGDYSPTALTRKSMYLDYSSMVGEIVRGRVVAHEKDGCIVMAGATVGFMPIREMSYQHCELWELLFPVGIFCDFMVCEKNNDYPGTTIYSFKRTYDNPFDIYNPRELKRTPTFNGEIVRANEDKAVVRILSKGIESKGAQIEALIPSMKVFSDGLQTIVPQAGTIVPLKLSKAEIGEDGKWIIEVRVVQNTR